MTIDGLTQMTARGFEEMLTKDVFKEGIKMILGEIRGLRDEIKRWRQENCIVNGQR